MRKADEYGREHREHIGLDERDQDLEAVKENPEEYGDHHHRTIDGGADLHCKEDDSHSAQDHDMTCKHVCKQSYHQREWLCKHPDKLYQRHNRKSLQEDGDIRPENILVVFFVAEEVHHEECKQRQHSGDGDISRDICAAGEDRDDAHQVGDEDEEECSQQIGGVFLILRPYDILDHIIVYHHDHRFHERGKPGRLVLCHIMLPVPSCTHKYQHDQQCGVKHQPYDVLGDGDVDRTPARRGIYYLAAVIESIRKSGLLQSP